MMLVQMRFCIYLSAIISFACPAVAQWNLAAVASPTGVTLSWDVAAGTGPYTILRNGAQIAQTTDTSYSDTTVQPATTYSYMLHGVTQTVSVSTPSLPAPPPPPLGSGTDAAGNQVGAILTLNAPAGAIVLAPSDNVQQRVSSAAANATFFLSPGVYRTGVTISPKSGQTFIGAQGAILNGSRLATTFGTSGSRYTITGMPSPTLGGGECASGFSRCRYTQDVFVDDKPLLAVGSVSGVNSTGKFYSSGGTITLFDNPAGHKVEVSVTPIAFNPSASTVTIRNLVVEKFSTPAQTGAIGGQLGSAVGWTIQNVEVRLNHGIGVSLPRGSALQSSYLHDNGEMGMGSGSGAFGMIVTDNELSRNNYAGYDCGWECGGAKMGDVHTTTLRGNHVHHNRGKRAPGLWCDEDCTDITFDANSIHDNPGPGIFYEISCRAVISGNQVSGNGFNDLGWFWADAILISASHHVEVFGNTLTDNFQGIVGVNQNRSTGTQCGPRIINHLNVHDNATTLSARSDGAAALVTDSGLNQIFTDANANKWSRNSYHLGNVAQAWFNWAGADKSAVQWQSTGQDVDGMFEP